jgi:hypothetical protein
MQFLKLVLASFGWASILVLQIMLLYIARFFQRSSGKKTGYPLYWIPIVLTFIGAGRYLLKLYTLSPGPDFTGDPIANLCLFSAGIFLIVLSGRLYEQMMGGSCP